MNGERKRNEEASTGRRTGSCAEARHRILIADPAALRGGDAALGAHLSECRECADDAARVLGDIDRLRVALIARGARSPAPARRSRSRVAVTLIPLALAAELALFAFLSSKDAPTPFTAPPTIDDTVTTLLPAVHTETDTGEVSRAPARTAGLSAAIVDSRAADDSALRADSARRENARSEVGGNEPVAQLQVVAPASRGQRVAVLGTTDPKVHVVWLTKVDSL